MVSEHARGSIRGRGNASWAGQGSSGRKRSSTLGTTIMLRRTLPADFVTGLTVAAKCYWLEVPDVVAMNSATNSAAFSGQRSNPTWRFISDQSSASRAPFHSDAGIDHLVVDLASA
jgi:hypothetical protein